MTKEPAILYVEDDLRSRIVMETLLRDELGLEHVTIFEDSQDFISKVEKVEPIPEVIFLDIHMKPINGFEMLELLRNHPTFSMLPIIALTASVMNAEIEQLRAAGFNGVIAKPIDMEAFPEILESIFDGEEIWMIAR